MKVTFVVGPTASGKSALALEMAEKAGGVIVNCDSVQSYAHVQIGAAKPEPEELARVPHFLYGYVEPPQEATVGDYHRTFWKLLPELEEQKVPEVFVVGGTGFYFQAIEKGLFETAKADPKVIAQLESEAASEEGRLRLHRQLAEVDPPTAAKIHSNDAYRLVRALEIWLSSGQRPSVLLEQKVKAATPFPYPLQKIGVHWERSQLHQRIEERVRQMLVGGLIHEVEELNKMGLKNWAPLKSVGYFEVQEFLAGRMASMTALQEQIVFATRQLAKRQITWFKRDPHIQWLSPS